MSTGAARERERLARFLLLAVVIILLVGAGAVLRSGLQTRSGPPSPSSAQQPAAIPAPPAAAQARAPSTAALRASKPVRVAIPSIGVASELLPLGLNRDRTIEVPKAYGEAGWYDLGITPGAVGPAVILGHVDSKSGPGVFFKIGALKPGAKVTVDLADHAVATFTVTSVAEYAKDAFPTDLVYGPLTYPGLRLITCGGSFDAATGHYLSNVVAFARLTGSHPA